MNSEKGQYNIHYSCVEIAIYSFSNSAQISFLACFVINASLGWKCIVRMFDVSRECRWKGRANRKSIRRNKYLELLKLDGSKVVDCWEYSQLESAVFFCLAGCVSTFYLNGFRGVTDLYPYYLFSCSLGNLRLLLWRRWSRFWYVYRYLQFSNFGGSQIWNPIMARALPNLTALKFLTS